MKKLLFLSICIAGCLSGIAQTILLQSDFSGWGNTVNLGPGHQCPTFDHLSIGINSPYSPLVGQWQRIGTPSQIPNTSSITLVDGYTKTEGLFTNFNLTPGVTYTVHFGVLQAYGLYSGSADALKIQLYATSHLQQTPDNVLPNCQEFNLDNPNEPIYWWQNLDQTNFNSVLPIIHHAGEINIPYSSSSSSTISDYALTYTPSLSDLQIAFYPQSTLVGDADVVLVLNYVRIERQPCDANFSYLISTSTPGIVNFASNDISSPAPSMKWTFGDGATSLYPNNVTHTYTSNNSYSPCLFIGSGKKGDCAICRDICVLGETQGIQEEDTTSCNANFTYGSNTASPYKFYFIPDAMGQGSYTFSYGDGSSSATVTSPTGFIHTYSQAGQYTACLKINKNCSKCTNICVTQPFPGQVIPGQGRMASSKDPTALTDARNALNIVPNPTTGISSVEIQSTTEEPATLVVRDITGKLLLKKDLQLIEGSNVTQINLEGYANGMYYMELNSKSISIKQKLLKL